MSGECLEWNWCRHIESSFLGALTIVPSEKKSVFFLIFFRCLLCSTNEITQWHDVRSKTNLTYGSKSERRKKLGSIMKYSTRRVSWVLQLCSFFWFKFILLWPDIRCRTEKYSYGAFSRNKNSRLDGWECNKHTENTTA